MANILRGNEVESSILPRTQVYKATHSEKDNSRLPYMRRSFISFSYGGRNIEDFNLIAVTEGDRLLREGYATFEDLTSVYDTIQGQFYWGTYFRNNLLTFNLATDGISLPELDDFKNWFIAGATRELVLAEHPNRAIMARVVQTPLLELLPFESLVELLIGELTYKTSTTLYRGEITLDLTMDEPFWYAKLNVLGILDTNEGYYSESWIDATGEKVQVRETPDALKIVYEDRIPMGSTALVSVFLGGDIYAAVVYKMYSFIAAGITEEIYNLNKDNDEDGIYYFNDGLDSIGSTVKFPETPYYCGAVIATMNGDTYVSGAKIGGADLTSNGENSIGVDLPRAQVANLYYAGTAPSPVNIYFTLTPVIDETTYLITSPYNSIGHIELPYNTITLTSKEDHEFRFTTPDIYTSYNLTILLIEALVSSSTAWMSVRELIRTLIRHPVIRAWANRVFDLYDNAGGSGVISGDINILKSNLKQDMSYLFRDANGAVFPAEFKFNARKGTARGIFTYRDGTYITKTPDNLNGRTAQDRGIAAEGLLIIKEEDVGDMVKSNYLILDERNVLSNKFQILAWSEDHPDYAYKVTHDVVGGLQSMRLEFLYMYL